MKHFFYFLILSIVVSNSIAQDVTVGENGTLSSNLLYYTSNSSSTFSRFVTVYTKAELASLPLNATLTAIAFQQQTAAFLKGKSVCKIYLKNTSSILPTGSATTWYTELQGATLLFDGDVQQMLNAGVGKKKFAFSTAGSFKYLGENVELLAEFEHETDAPSAPNMQMYTSTDYTLLLYGNGKLPTTDHKFSTFMQKPSMVFYYNTILPVQFKSVVAQKIESNNIITWETWSEINNASFTVEGSEKGSAFKEVATVLSKARRSNEENSYQYIDDKNIHYKFYRIRQNDKNGNNSLSKVITVNAALNLMDAKLLNNVSVASDLYIEVSSIQNLTLHIDVVDMQGRIVTRNTRNVQQGLSRVNIIVGHLPQGCYYVKLKSNGKELFKPLNFIKS